MQRLLAPFVLPLLCLTLSAPVRALDLPSGAQGKDTLAPKAKPQADAGAKDPADFPRAPGLVRQTYSQDPGRIRDTEIATYHAAAGMEEVASHYLEQLQAAGWKKGSDSVSGSDIHRVRIIEWTLPGKEAELRFYALKGSGSDLRVRTFTYKTVTRAGVADAAPAAATPAQAAAGNAAAKSKEMGAAPLGPPPKSLNVTSYNPYSHNLTWSADTWTSFNLYRRDAAGETLVAEKTTATGMIDHAYLAPGTVYRLVVHHVDGSEGSLEYTYANPPQPGVVTGLKAEQTGPGKVKLTWNRAQPMVNNSGVAETYQVTSPTSAVFNQRLGTNALEVASVPLGNHWARVAMVYGDSSQMAPAPKDVAVNFDVLTDRARYRITFLGLECLHETADDPLQLDGKRDEVYLGAYLATVPRLNGNNPPTPIGAQPLRTKVMGDINGFPDRLQAGTASDKGGIQTGDFVPDATITTPKIAVQGTADRFPLAVWEGELADTSDFLIIAPCLFEWDSKDETAWNSWVEWWSTPNGSVQLGDAARQSPPDSLGAMLSLTWKTEAYVNLDGYRFSKYYGPNFTNKTNQPVGLVDQAITAGVNTVPDLYWIPKGMVVTRTKLEKLLGTQNSAVVPWAFGVMLGVNDSPDLAGYYKLYVQIDRLATPPPPVAPTGGGAAPAAPRPEIATANPALVNQGRVADLSKQSGAAAAGPPPTNLRVMSIGPVTQALDWSADNWTSFDVYRIDSKGRTQVAANLNKISFNDHAYLEAHTTYRVDVHHTDGSVGSAEYDYAKPPAPETPAGFRAVQTGPGAVRLSWVIINGVNGYQLYGPTLPAEGKFISSGYQADVTGLPLGQHEFRLAVVYSGDGTLYPAPNQAKAAVTVNRVADRYRLTLLGVQCVHETTDDLLQLDGKHDEVFAGAYVAALPDDAPLSLIGTVRTKVMGDTNGFPDRLPAGTASAKGGIQTGDFVPDATITTAKPGVTGTTDRFPLLLWEGVLSDTGGMVIVAPVVFEWDKPGDAPWNDFVGWWTTPRAMTDVPRLAHADYTDKHWDMVLSSTWDVPINAYDSYPRNYGLDYPESGGNRPIGVEDQANIQGSGFVVPDPVYVPTGLCLSHAKVEAALGTQGTMLIRWRAHDEPHVGQAKLDGEYILYIQIERLAPPKQTGPEKLR